jgi:hypothetical protein
VLTSLINTLSQKDLNKNILDPMRNGHAVKMLGGFLGDKNKIPRNRGWTN